MARRNALTSKPPDPVVNALKSLGANLRTARLRRNLTIADVAAKIGTGPRAVGDAEKGKPGSSAGVYAALLWVYGSLEPLAALADPNKDTEGQALAAKNRVRARRQRHVARQAGPER